MSDVRKTVPLNRPTHGPRTHTRARMSTRMSAQWSSKDGVAYELAAIHEYAQKHPGRAVFTGEEAPAALLAIASGCPVTEESIVQALDKYNAKVNTALSEKTAPPSRSHIFGLDAIDVDAAALKLHSSNALDVCVIEAKSSTSGIDAHELGPTMTRQFKTASRVGFDALPVLRLIAPERPTPKVYEAFEAMPHKFKVSLIGRSVAVPRTIQEFRAFPWQRSMARRATLAWNGESQFVKATAVMGMGKTIAALLTLQSAENQPLRLFAAHTTAVAADIIEEAKTVGISMHDVTCRNTTRKLTRNLLKLSDEEAGEEEAAAEAEAEEEAVAEAEEAAEAAAGGAGGAAGAAGRCLIHM